MPPARRPPPSPLPSEARVPKAAARPSNASGVGKYLSTFVGLALAVAFVAVFFAGRETAQPLTDVAPRIGMSYDELMQMGPRVAANTGATLGTARHVVYLLACSGLATKDNLEAQATDASRLTRVQRLSDREAVLAVVAQTRPAEARNESMKNC